MSTKHVILALLDIMPMSGYDLSKNMAISLDSLWSATTSQIYPTLHKLEREQLVTSTVVSGEKNRDRIVYALTDSGRAALTAWLNEPVSYLPFRDPFRLWASNVDRLDLDVVLATIDRHIALHRARAVDLAQVAAAIEDRSHPLIQARAERLPPERLQRLCAARAFVFRELAAAAEFEVASAWRLRAFALSLAEERPAQG